MTESMLKHNPYESPVTGNSAQTHRNPVITLAFVVVGIAFGAVSFATSVCWIGFYVGACIHGFDRQPPAGFVIIGALVGALGGSLAGGIAAIKIRSGNRLRLSWIVIGAVVNTSALLGTIDMTTEISMQSLTVRDRDCWSHDRLSRRSDPWRVAHNTTIGRNRVGLGRERCFLGNASPFIAESGWLSQSQQAAPNSGRGPTDVGLNRRVLARGTRAACWFRGLGTRCPLTLTAVTDDRRERWPRCLDGIRVASPDGERSGSTGGFAVGGPSGLRPPHSAGPGSGTEGLALHFVVVFRSH